MFDSDNLLRPGDRLDEFENLQTREMLFNGSRSIHRNGTTCIILEKKVKKICYASFHNYYNIYGRELKIRFKKLIL